MADPYKIQPFNSADAVKHVKMEIPAPSTTAKGMQNNRNSAAIMQLNLDSELKGTAAGAVPQMFATTSRITNNPVPLTAAGYTMSGEAGTPVYISNSAGMYVPPATAINPDMQPTIERVRNGSTAGTVIHESAHTRQDTEWPIGDTEAANTQQVLKRAIQMAAIKETPAQRDGHINPLIYSEQPREVGAEIAKLYGLTPTVHSIGKGMVAPKFTNTVEGQILAPPKQPYGIIGKYLGMPSIPDIDTLGIIKKLTGVPVQ